MSCGSIQGEELVSLITFILANLTVNLFFTLLYNVHVVVVLSCNIRGQLSHTCVISLSYLHEYKYLCSPYSAGCKMKLRLRILHINLHIKQSVYWR